MSIWEVLDPDSRKVMIDEVSPELVLFGDADFDSPVEPLFKNTAGNFVRLDGTVIPQVTLRDPAGVKSNFWLWAAAAAAAVALLAL